MQILISGLYLLIEVAVVGFICWLIVAAMALFTWIPEGIKTIVKNAVYFIGVIVSLLLIIGWLVALVGGNVSFPILPPGFHVNGGYRQ